MLFINRLLLVGLLSVGITAATTAQAGNQLFTAEWFTFSFGNERTGGIDPSDSYTGFGIPQGIQCNAVQPRCAFQSTPVSVTPMGATGTAFAPLGGTLDGLYPRCLPWYNWQGMGTNVRPAKGATAVDTKGRPIPPLYRNPAFFTASTPNAQPNATFCSATSTDGAGGKGLVQVGHPVTGKWTAATTGTQKGGFSFIAAPVAVTAVTAGIRTTGLVGDFPALYPYVYSYTYATLRNDYGVFGPGSGPGSFNLKYYQGALTVASIQVTQGANKFGGTMRMLGALTTKVCYYRAGGCSLGRNNWRYDAVGASAMLTMGGLVGEGYSATYKAYYYHTGLMLKSTVNVYGVRFPWTTGMVTLTATGRGPHKTVHYATGYDNRNTTTATGKGTIQLVTPILTRWIQPCCKFETGGVGILRIKFVPEPQTWAMLVAGVSLLGVGYRMRGR